MPTLTSVVITWVDCDNASKILAVVIAATSKPTNHCFIVASARTAGQGADLGADATEWFGGGGVGPGVLHVC